MKNDSCEECPIRFECLTGTKPKIIIETSDGSTSFEPVDEKYKDIPARCFIIEFRDYYILDDGETDNFEEYLDTDEDGDTYFVIRSELVRENL